MPMCTQRARDKAPLVPSLVTTLRSGYSFSLLGKDLSAGITVGVVALPLALAFAIASGLSPEQGLYTAIVAGFFMAFFSGSRFPVSGPTGAFVVIIYNIVSRHGYDGLVLTTLMAGVLLILFGLLRLGALVKFIPYPVTTGFTTGIALLILSSQMKDFFGLPLADTPPEFFDKWGAYAKNALDFSPATVGVSLLTLAIMLLVRRKIPKIPAPVVGVFLATVVVWLFNLPADTIGSRFGAMPTGLPEFSLPTNITFERIRLLLPDALTIALLAGIESLLACVVADGMTGDRHNSNMELVAQGVGNIAAVFFGGFAATGAIARTATNVRAGAQSSVAAIVHSVFLVAVLLWFLPLIEFIPLAALAAVLVMVAYDMSDLRTLRHMFHGPKSDWSVMLLTFTLTVIFDLTVAVYMGVMVASLLFMRRMGELTQISCAQEDEGAADIPVSGEDVPDGVQIFSINGPLFFGIADRFQATLDAMETPPKVFILYLHNTPSIDMTGIHALESFLARRIEGCHILLADMQPPARRTLTKVGIVRAVGEENIFPSLAGALAKARELVG
ncbi:MAG: sulfate permease [Bilophila sp.]